MLTVRLSAACAHSPAELALHGMASRRHYCVACRMSFRPFQERDCKATGPLTGRQASLLRHLQLQATAQWRRPGVSPPQLLGHWQRCCLGCLSRRLCHHCRLSKVRLYLLAAPTRTCLQLLRSWLLFVLLCHEACNVQSMQMRVCLRLRNSKGTEPL